MGYDHDTYTCCPYPRGETLKVERLDGRLAAVRVDCSHGVARKPGLRVAASFQSSKVVR